MRIAFDYQAFVRQSYGGISRYFTCLATGLLELNQEVQIFAPLHRNNYLSVLPRHVVNGRQLNRYPAYTAWLILAYNDLVANSAITKWTPDLVHETFYSMRRSTSRQCPTVITAYDMIPELFPDECSIADNAGQIKRIAIERADHVICISENTKSDLMRLYGTSPDKLSVVHLGFDQFATTRGLAQIATRRSKPYLLYVGERAGYKNFLGFLRAVASSPRLLSDFDISAFGGGRFSDTELREIAGLGFRPNQVKQISGSDDLLGRSYSGARAFIYPSLYEGFGIPPLEAMAHQCPVVSSNTSSMPEVIGNAGAFFDPRDLDNMRHVIESIVYSGNEINNLVMAGTERLKAFSWKKCARETLQIYTSLLG